MYSFKLSSTTRNAFRSIAAFALLSSPWLVATAAPVLSGAPATTVVAGHYYAFQPAASDSAGKKLTFSITNRPSWAQFNTADGRLAGTPYPQSNVGTFANILITASDGTSHTNLPRFSVTVLPLPQIPPRLSGTPATAVIAGHPYSFQPSVTDPNGLRVQFGIRNQPTWASFDAATGRLSGTPPTASAGMYANILIIAYDGYMKAELPAFSIDVQTGATATPPPVVSTQTGSATLSWAPPTDNTNGTVLANLAGYHIYYGTTPELGQSVTVANPGLTRYVLSGLTADTWYFSMTAYNSAGLESAATAVKSLVIQ
jgi:Putative Ig domain